MPPGGIAQFPRFSAKGPTYQGSVPTQQRSVYLAVRSLQAAAISLQTHTRQTPDFARASRGADVACFAQCRAMSEPAVLSPEDCLPSTTPIRKRRARL